MVRRHACAGLGLAELGADVPYVNRATWSMAGPFTGACCRSVTSLDVPMAVQVGLANSALVVTNGYEVSCLWFLSPHGCRWKWYSYIDFARYTWGAVMINQFEHHTKPWIGEGVVAGQQQAWGCGAKSGLDRRRREVRAGLLKAAERHGYSADRSG